MKKFLCFTSKKAFLPQKINHSETISFICCIKTLKRWLCTYLLMSWRNRLRHPYTLKVIEVMPENPKEIVFVTERVTCSLANMCNNFTNLPTDSIPKSIKESTLSQFEATCGLVVVVFVRDVCRFMSAKPWSSCTTLQRWFIWISHLKTFGSLPMDHGNWLVLASLSPLMWEAHAICLTAAQWYVRRSNFHF